MPHNIKRGKTRNDKQKTMKKLDLKHGRDGDIRTETEKRYMTHCRRRKPKTTKIMIMNTNMKHMCKPSSLLEKSKKPWVGRHKCSWMSRTYQKAIENHISLKGNIKSQEARATAETMAAMEQGQSEEVPGVCVSM